MTVYSHICERCDQPFVSTRRQAQFCGYVCRSWHQRKIHLEALKPFAMQGLPRKEIAAAFEVQEATVLSALRRYGLYGMWLEQRWA